MICQLCGVEAPTKYVAFYGNMGAVLIRFTESVEGHICKSCIHRTFWKYTPINLILGWWSPTGFVCTPFLIVNNLCRYICCLGLKPVPPGAVRPKIEGRGRWV